MTNVTKVRETFEDHQDGLTLRQLIEATGLPYVSAYKAVVSLPCVYVDRWTPDCTLFKWMAVYCAADGERPEDTPKPVIKVKAYMRRMQ